MTTSIQTSPSSNLSIREQLFAGLATPAEFAEALGCSTRTFDRLPLVAVKIGPGNILTSLDLASALYSSRAASMNSPGAGALGRPSAYDRRDKDPLNTCSRRPGPDAWRCDSAMASGGRRVRIANLPGLDFNDVLMARPVSKVANA
jgi:hypothetical protein